MSDQARCPSRDDDDVYEEGVIGLGDDGPFRLFYRRHSVPLYADFADRETAEAIAESVEDRGEAFVVCLQDTRTGEVLTDHLAEYRDWCRR